MLMVTYVFCEFEINIEILVCQERSFKFVYSHENLALFLSKGCMHMAVYFKCETSTRGQEMLFIV